MGRLLEEATDALARLDAGALGELERRALELKSLLSSDVTSLQHIQAGYRVFAGVVRATSENLGVLDRSGSSSPYGAARMRTPWDL